MSMILISAAAALALATPQIQTKPAESIYAFTTSDIDGRSVPLKKFQGKVLLVVNVASYCGLTPQYAGLEKLYKKYKEQGLVVLGFPANDFRKQEPGSNEDIKKFCTENYQVTFPLFSKISVAGDQKHELYKWLIASAPYHDEIEWNFGKFLLGRNGKVIARFAPKTEPESSEIVQAIEAALKAK